MADLTYGFRTSHSSFLIYPLLLPQTQGLLHTSVEFRRSWDVLHRDQAGARAAAALQAIFSLILPLAGRCSNLHPLTTSGSLQPCRCSAELCFDFPSLDGRISPYVTDCAPAPDAIWCPASPVWASSGGVVPPGNGPLNCSVRSSLPA